MGIVRGGILSSMSSQVTSIFVILASFCGIFAGWDNDPNQVAPVEYVSTLRQLMKSLEWTKIAVLMDDHSDVQLMSIFQEAKLMTVYHIGDMDDWQLKALLTRLHTMLFPNLNFLLLCNYSRALSLLEMVEQFDLNSNRTTDYRHFSFWVVSTYSVCPPLGNGSGIRLMENVVVLCRDAVGDTALRHLHTTRTEMFTHTTHWQDGSTSSEVFPNSDFGLNKRQLTVSIVLSDPFAIQTESGYEGFVIDLIVTLAAFLNCSFRIVHPEGMRWGGLVNGSWDGLVGQLERREVDLIATVSINEDREKVMDFLYPPIFTDVDDIMYKMHSQTEGSWNLYLKPFQSPLLLSLLASLVVCITIAVSLAQCKFHHTPILYGYNSNMDDLNFADTVMYFYGMLLNRGVSADPSMMSTRILMFSWGVFSVIVAACYGANLVAALTVKKEELPFNSLSELVRQEEYKWGVVPGAVREHIFRKSTDADMRLAWQGMVAESKRDPEVLSEDFNTHLSKVQKEKYAFIITRYTIDKARTTDCSVRRVGQTIMRHQFGLGVPTGYPLKREFEQALGVMTDVGLLDVWWRRWSKTKFNHCNNRVNTVKPLGIAGVSSAFYILIVGMAAGLISLIIEYIIYRQFRVVRHRH